MLTVIACIVCTVASHGQNKVTINAQIKGITAGSWVYYYPLTDRARKDSAQTKTDGFSFAIQIPKGEGDVYLLQIGKTMKDNDVTFVYLDEGTVKLKGEGPGFKNIRYSGARSIVDYAAYGTFIERSPALKGYIGLVQKARDLYTKKDTIAYAALKPELKRLDSSKSALTKQWILQHPASPVSAFLLSFELGRLELSEKDSIYNQLSPGARENGPAKRIANSIRIDKLTGIGQMAIDFTQNDTAGQPVTLSSFRGKYVLIDFWASWCVPCRGENPNVVKAYTGYKDKNFTVLGVSLDQQNGKEKWIKAIHDDRLTWTHVSDLNYWNNAVARQYDIHSIPFNLLISPEGRILAKDLHGDELEKKLTELLGAASTASPVSGGSFVLNGRLTGEDGWIHLYYPGADDRQIDDSARTSNGQFTFKGSIDAPQAAWIVLNTTTDRIKQQANTGEFFISPGNMDITLVQDDFAHGLMTGSASNDEFRSLRGSYEPVTAKYKIQRDSLVKEKDHDKAAAIRERLAPYYEAMRQKDYDFFNAHPRSAVTASMLKFHVGDLPLDSLQGYYDRLGRQEQQTADGRNLAGEIAKLRSGSPGSTAKDFTAIDINGKPLTLSAFRGRSVVLIDFWASWCVPCRHSNPHLKDVYRKYHNKGLEVIGVSDDDSKPEAWEKAVAQDGVGIWHNVLRGLDRMQIRKDETNEKDINKKFAIHYLPTKILIDKNGVIIGRYGESRDDEASLDKKLEEILL